MQLAEGMKLAIEEARLSLREGNNGFGAVITHNNSIVSQAHDTEISDSDPTAHAEINAIKLASKKLGKDLSGCILITTHEPCPMCTTATIWAGITEVAFGYSIKEAISQGRKRIDVPCSELYKRACVSVKIHSGVLRDECSVLYRADVRAEIEKLRNANEQRLAELNAKSTFRRVKWFEENHKKFEFLKGDDLSAGYKLLIKRFNTTEAQMPIITRTKEEIVFHSQNFCPTLEACKILSLDTRVICRGLNERATNALVKQVNSRLTFSRNYEKLRPYIGYCEEKISLARP